MRIGVMVVVKGGVRRKREERKRDPVGRGEGVLYSITKHPNWLLGGG